MKNLSIACLLVLLASVSARAQTLASTQTLVKSAAKPSPTKVKEEADASKLFIKIYASYGLPLASSSRPQNTITTGNNNDYHYETLKKGLGQGLKVGGGIGYIVNEVINLGLDVDYYSSGDILSTYTSKYTPADNSYTETDNFSYSYKSTMLTVTPNITFKAISKPNFYVYNRLGISIGASTSLTYATTDSIVQVGTNYLSKSGNRSFYDYKGGIPLGFMASLGIQAKLTDKIRVFAEIQASNITYSPKKSSLTKQIANGKAVDLSKVDVVNKETEYESSYDYRYQYPIPEELKNSPGKQIKQKFIYASIGLSIGLAYRF